MPRIVIVTEEMISPHGTQMLAALLIDEAVRRGWQVVIFTAQYSRTRSAWQQFLRERGVAVFAPGFWFLTRHHLPHRVTAWRLWRHVRRHGPTLVWSPDNEPLTCHALESLPQDAPPFFVHDPSEASPDCPHYSSLWFAESKRVAGLTVHGHRQAKAARNYYRVSCPIQAVWPASFPPHRELYPPRTAGPIRFGQFGRLYAQKGPLFAVAALARVREMGYAAELHFFGQGIHASLVKELVDSLRLSQQVVFHGAYDWRDLDTIVEMVDVGLMPSIYEGFGLVMLELMSRGRPVISSDVGSSREVLEGLGGGWVVRRADTEDLAQKMALCCQNPGLVLQAGEVARRVWQMHFTPAQMFDRYLAFWRSCGVKV
jgi:glycosyltransferase involved in cell wall biosynthesis